MSKDQINKKVGENIRNVRVSMGLTQQELSEYISLSPTFLSLIESGKKDAAIHILLAISDVLDIPLNSLVNINYSLFLFDNIESSLKIKKNFILILLSSLDEPDLNFLITMIKYIRNIRTV